MSQRHDGGPAGSITAVVAHEIEARRSRCREHPDRELLEHLLIAVQRERVAAVGYDRTRLAERLAAAPLPEEARRAIATAITQIWVDETQHARYLVGVLLRQRDLLIELGARRQDAEGSVGGWIAAVTQHTSWKDAPVERLTAALLEAGARLVGSIPDEVQKGLGHMSLQNWCAFAADAERSATISFARMLELAAELAADPARFTLHRHLPEGFAQELSRMARDERAHCEVFELLAAHLGEDDGLVDGKCSHDLRAALRGVEGWLAEPVHGAAAHADALYRAHRVCSGGLVVIARGATDAEKIATFDRALSDARLFDTLAACGTPEQVSIAIKIDLLLAYHRDDRSSFIDPALVERLVEALWQRGHRDIVVCDAQNVYGRFYANRSIENVARYVGLAPSARYRLVDLADEQEPHVFRHAMGVYAIGRSWRDARFRISFAKLKTHPTAVGQLTLRNTGTVVPQNGAYFFSDRLADFSRVTAAVLHDFPPHFGIIDGYSDAADGLLGVMADPTPKHPRIIVAGADVASVDYVGFWLMGERDPTRASDLRAAIELFGDPRPHGRVLGDPTPLDDWDRAEAGLLGAPLAALASPVYASLSHHGALFTAPMDEVAFPPIGESRVLSVARKALRVLLGIDR